MAETSGSITVSTKLERIAKLAREMPQAALTTLAHHIDIDWLREAYRRTRKNGATGVDRQTAAEYAGDLEVNLRSLLERAHWAKSRKGYWVVKQKTAAARLRRALKRIADWCRLHRHEPVRDQWKALKRKLLGHYGYFGITGNYPALHNFSIRVIGAWRKWLSRRSQRAWISVEKMKRLLERYPLPQPRLRTSPVT